MTTRNEYRVQILTNTIGPHGRQKGDWETQSTWSTREAAEKECARLKRDGERARLSAVELWEPSK